MEDTIVVRVSLCKLYLDHSELRHRMQGNRSSSLLPFRQLHYSYCSLDPMSHLIHW